MTLQPLKLYGHSMGPNPFKVEIILAELDLPYKRHEVEFADMKKPEYEAVNPNGRVPALEDPNTGITTWESGAIVQYLIETYDKEHKLSHASGQEKWQETTWLHFQMSGQGPYFGQYVWLGFVHPERIPSVVERYRNEIKRVTMVLDRELKNKEYLVGGRCTYADLAFSPWHWVVEAMGNGLWEELEKEYPHFMAWHNRLEARPTVKKFHAERAKNFESSPLNPKNRKQGAAE